MFTTEQKTLQVKQPRQKPVVLKLKVDRCNKLLDDKITKMENNKKVDRLYLLIRSYQVPVLLICPLALSLKLLKSWTFVILT